MRHTIIRLFAAAAIAAGGVTSSIALADPQEHGYGDKHGDDGDNGGRHDNGKHKGWDKQDDRRGDNRGDDNRGYSNGRGDRGGDNGGYGNRRSDDRRNFSAYDYNRPDPRYGEYRADRYYRQGNYAPRRMQASERVYRGGDGRYYCRRNDGTTGLVIGAVGGGALGNIIAPGGSKTLGTVLGALGGGLIGRGVDRGNVTCR